GILSGGASLAFAETLGGLGSALLVDLEKYSVVGAQVAANHVGIGKGDSVRGEARIIHRGKRTHVWNIDVISEDNYLVTTVRMTNQIIER
ncbi:MAG: PaaI family thioesterase, partial [Bacteroidales bacterium]|nr:PaaI family thioesterase [Bacteroidales bacterium]